MSTLLSFLFCLILLKVYGIYVFIKDSVFERQITKSGRDRKREKKEKGMGRKVGVVKEGE